MVDIKHPDLSKASNQEIIDYITRAYPIGTIHKGYSSTNSYKVYKISTIDNNLFMGGNTGCIYKKKENYWAPIVSYPENYSFEKLYELW